MSMQRQKADIYMPMIAQYLQNTCQCTSNQTSKLYKCFNLGDEIADI